MTDRCEHIRRDESTRFAGPQPLARLVEHAIVAHSLRSPTVQIASIIDPDDQPLVRTSSTAASLLISEALTYASAESIGCTGGFLVVRVARDEERENRVCLTIEWPTEERGAAGDISRSMLKHLQILRMRLAMLFVQGVSLEINRRGLRIALHTHSVPKKSRGPAGTAVLLGLTPDLAAILSEQLVLLGYIPALPTNVLDAYRILAKHPRAPLVAPADLLPGLMMSAPASDAPMVGVRVPQTERQVLTGQWLGTPLTSLRLRAAIAAAAEISENHRRHTVDPANTVAVVEDNRVVRKLLQGYLEAARWKVLAIPSSDDLTPVMVQDATCIILDIHSGQKSARDIVGEIRAAQIGVPIIAISGDDSGFTETRCLRDGMSAFLVKPVDPDDLLDTLNLVTQRPGNSLPPSASPSDDAHLAVGARQ